MTSFSRASLTVPAYSFAHYGKSLFWEMTELMFAFYLAEIFGVEPAILGVLLFVFLIWDAVTDPVLGAATRGRNASIAALSRFQFIGALVSSACFFAIFYKPDVSGSLLIFYALCVGLLFRTAYTIYDVPQNTLLKRFTSSPESRVSVASLRIAGSAVGSLTVGAATASILSRESAAEQAAAFSNVAAIFSVVAITSALLLFLLTRRAPQAAAEETAPLPTPIRDILKRPDLRMIFIARFVLSAGSTMFGRLLPFFAAYVLFSPAAAGVFITVMAVAELSAQPVLTWFGRTRSRRVFAAVITAFAVLASIGFFFMGSVSIAAATAFVFLRAAAFCALNLLTWTRLADVLSAPDQTPANDMLAFGAFTFSSKLGLGVGGLLLGGVLVAAGYEQGGALSESGKWLLVGAMSLVPMAAALVSMQLMFGSKTSA